MRIGIDARMLGKGFGLARYIEQLVLHLEKIDTENEYSIFLKKDNWDFFEPKNSHFKKVLADIPWYSWEEQLKLSGILKKEKLELIHFPHFNVPLFWRGPFIVTIHDLIMFHYPRVEASTHGPVVYWIKDKIHRVVIRHAVKKAKKVIMTSEFTKRDVHETFGVPIEKMVVMYQAPFVVEKIDRAPQEGILEKYGIKKPYILYVGAAYPHKNLDGLLEAWKIFQKKYGDAHQLVLVGKENFFYTKLKNTLLKEASNVIYTEFVLDDELAILYDNATLYVFPSLYEGFGLPPLEAMTHGVPVVSSNKSCLPEVLQNAALYFDPESTEGMADTIYRGITDEQIRTNLKQNAQKLLQKYSWYLLAQTTLSLYKKVNKGG